MRAWQITFLVIGAAALKHHAVQHAELASVEVSRSEQGPTEEAAVLPEAVVEALGEIMWAERLLPDLFPYVGLEMDNYPSCAVQCTMVLTCGYFLIYGLLMYVRQTNEIYGVATGSGQKAFEAAAVIVNQAPMLAIMFIAVRMRAMRLGGGVGAPQVWAQDAMVACVGGLLVQVVLVLFLPCFSGVTPELDEDGKVKKVEMGHPVFAVIFTILHFAVFIATNAGLLLIVLGALALSAESTDVSAGASSLSLLAQKQIPDVSGLPISEYSVFGFSVGFFLIQFLNLMMKAGRELGGDLASKGEEITKMALSIFNFAPMLSVLFMAAKLRANSMDMDLPEQCKLGMLGAAGALGLQVLFIFFMGCCGGEIEKGETEGDVKFKHAFPCMGIFLDILRYVCLIATYVGFAVVAMETVNMAPDLEANPDAVTPKLSATLQNTIILSVVFFAMYFLNFAMWSIRQCSDTGAMGRMFTQAISNGIVTVQLAPMLCILFLGVRLFHYRMFQQDGKPCFPPVKVQNYMFAISASIGVQLVMIFVMPLLAGEAPAEKKKEEAKEGEEIKPLSPEKAWPATPASTHPMLASLLMLVRYGSLLGMYAGAVMVAMSVKLTTEGDTEGWAPDCSAFEVGGDE